MKFIDDFIIKRGLDKYMKQYNIDGRSMIALFWCYGFLTLEMMQAIAKLYALGRLRF